MSAEIDGKVLKELHGVRRGQTTKDCFERLPLTLVSSQTSFGVRLSHIHFSPTDISPWWRNEYVTNEPQRTSAGRLPLTPYLKQNVIVH